MFADLKHMSKLLGAKIVVENVFLFSFLQIFTKSLEQSELKIFIYTIYLNKLAFVFFITAGNVGLPN